MRILIFFLAASTFVYASNITDADYLRAHLINRMDELTTSFLRKEISDEEFEYAYTEFLDDLREIDSESELK